MYLVVMGGTFEQQGDKKLSNLATHSFVLIWKKKVLAVKRTKNMKTDINAG